MQGKGGAPLADLNSWIVWRESQLEVSSVFGPSCTLIKTASELSHMKLVK